MQIGMTQCAMWGKTLDQFLPVAAAAGFQTVELAVSATGELTHQSTPAQLQSVRDKLAAHGLSLNSVALLCQPGTLLDHAEAAAASVQATIDGLKVARDLGATMALVTTGRLRPDLFYEDGYHHGIASFRKIGKAAQDLGVDVAVEFVWNGFLFSPLEFRRFLEAVDSPRVGFYFDPGNMAVYQQPAHWVRALKNHIKGVHLKDWTGGPLNGKWTGLLEGQVDFPAVMRELKQSSFKGALISEVDPQLQDPAATLAAARKIAAM